MITIQETSVNTLTASTRNRTRGLIAASILGALAMSSSVVFSAETSATGTEPVRVNVGYADLDISNPASALVLYNRIERAAENACSYWWFKTNADQNRCVHDAIANAVARVNQPRLFAIYNAKHKTPLPTTLISQSN
jgi:UrcA family protein